MWGSLRRDCPAGPLAPQPMCIWAWAWTSSMGWGGLAGRGPAFSAILQGKEGWPGIWGADPNGVEEVGDNRDWLPGATHTSHLT